MAEMNVFRMGISRPGKQRFDKAEKLLYPGDTSYCHLIEFSSCARLTLAFAICVRARLSSSSM